MKDFIRLPENTPGTIQYWVNGMCKTVSVPDYSPLFETLNTISTGIFAQEFLAQNTADPIVLWEGKYAILDTLGLWSKIHKTRYKNHWVGVFHWMRNTVNTLPIPYLENLMDFFAQLDPLKCNAFVREMVAITPTGEPLLERVQNHTSFWVVAKINSQGEVILSSWAENKAASRVLQGHLTMLETYLKINEELAQPPVKPILHLEELSSLPFYYWGDETPGVISWPTSQAFTVLSKSKVLPQQEPPEAAQSSL